MRYQQPVAPCAREILDADVPYWTHEPRVLVLQCFEVVPYGWMTPNRKANALMRLAFLIALVLLINRMRGGDTNTGVIFVMATLVAVVLAIMLMSRRMNRPDYGPVTTAVACRPMPVAATAEALTACDGTPDACGEKETDTSNETEHRPIMELPARYNMSARSFERETSNIYENKHPEEHASTLGWMGIKNLNRSMHI